MKFPLNRECGDCQGCCQGWLIGEAYGVKFGVGKPCAFLQGQCMIYDMRPDVCKNYYCAWRQGLFSEKLKPTISNVLISVSNWSKGQYLRCSEMGQKMSDEALLEITEFCKTNNTPYVLQYDGQWSYNGPPDFIQEAQKAVSV
jgi:hypothetical protein